MYKRQGAICRAVEHAGYGAFPKGDEKSGGKAQAQDEPAREAQRQKRGLIASICFLVPLFYLSMGHMLGWPVPGFFLGEANAMAFALTLFLLTLPIVAINRHYFINGFKSLLHGAPTMDSLIAIGSGAALVYGVIALYRIGYALGAGDMMSVHHAAMDLYFESAGMILTLISVGKYLEARAKGKTSAAIARLVQMAPKTAVVLRDGQETELPVAQVRVGDTVVVRPGQVVPVDGEVLELSLIHILIRKDWLDEMGLSMPGSWKEMIEVGKAFRSRGSDIYGVAFGVVNGGIVGNYGTMNGGAWYDADGNANVDTEANLSLMQFIRDMKDAGILPEGIEGYQSEDARKLFLAEKVGIINGG